MNDREFNALADVALKRIETGLERSGADLDFEMVSDSVLEIEFSDRSRIIVNRHDAAQEIWVAARSGGFHYRWDGSNWNAEVRIPIKSSGGMSYITGAGPGQVWIAGYWTWNGTQHVWTPGHVEAAPRRGARWSQPRWMRRGRTWVFTPGAWR